MEKHLYEKPEKRDGIVKTNPKGNYDENVNNVMNENNEKKLSRQSIRTPMGEPVIELFGETAFENTLDKDPGKHKVHKKPEKRDVEVNINPEGKHDEDVNGGNMNNAVRKLLYKKPEKRDVKDDIIDAVLLNTEYEAGIKTH